MEAALAVLLALLLPSPPLPSPPSPFSAVKTNVDVLTDIYGLASCSVLLHGFSAVSEAPCHVQPTSRRLLLRDRLAVALLGRHLCQPRAARAEHQPRRRRRTGTHCAERGGSARGECRCRDGGGRGPRQARSDGGGDRAAARGPRRLSWRGEAGAEVAHTLATTQAWKGTGATGSGREGGAEAREGRVRVREGERGTFFRDLCRLASERGAVSEYTVQYTQ